MRQPRKMVKNTQKIRRLLPTNCFSVFHHFAELAFNGFNKYLQMIGIHEKQQRHK